LIKYCLLPVKRAESLYIYSITVFSLPSSYNQWAGSYWATSDHMGSYIPSLLWSSAYERAQLAEIKSLVWPRAYERAYYGRAVIYIPRLIGPDKYFT